MSNTPADKSTLRNYYRVRVNPQGVPTKNEGMILLDPVKHKHYQCALGVKLMRHLPHNLR